MFKWPGKIKSGQVSAGLVGMPDIYRTALAVAKAKLPDHTLDGHDLVPFLTGKAEKTPRKEYFYFRGQLEAVRVGDWKLRTKEGEPELFHMGSDPFERYNRAADHSEVVTRLSKRMQEMAGEVGVKVRGWE
jgi:arylsulfatase A-like enzyme